MTPARLRQLLIATLLCVQVGTVGVFVLDARYHWNNELNAHAQGALSALERAIADRSQRFLEPAERAISATEQLFRTGMLDVDNASELE